MLKVKWNIVRHWEGSNVQNIGVLNIQNSQYLEYCLINDIKKVFGVLKHFYETQPFKSKQSKKFTQKFIFLPNFVIL